MLTVSLATLAKEFGRSEFELAQAFVRAGYVVPENVGADGFDFLCDLFGTPPASSAAESDAPILAKSGRESTQDDDDAPSARCKLVTHE